MRLAALLVPLLLAGAAHAAEPVHVYDDGGTVIKLWDRPCAGAMAGMVAALMPAQAARFKEITSTFAMGRDGRAGRKDFAGCWIELKPEEARGQEGLIGMIFEDGDSAVVPKADFKRYPRKGQTGA